MMASSSVSVVFTAERPLLEEAGLRYVLGLVNDLVCSAGGNTGADDELPPAAVVARGIGFAWVGLRRVVVW